MKTFILPFNHSIRAFPSSHTDHRNADSRSVWIEIPTACTVCVTEAGTGTRSFRAARVSHIRPALQTSLPIVTITRAVLRSNNSFLPNNIALTCYFPPAYILLLKPYIRSLRCARFNFCHNHPFIEDSGSLSVFMPAKIDSNTHSQQHLLLVTDGAYYNA